MDDLVRFYEKRDIPLAINHCVSLYRSEDGELELDQIDYLKSRYPNHVIGLSIHEHHDWQSSMLISYNKGARSWELSIYLGGVCWPIAGLFTMDPILNRSSKNLNPHLPVQGVRVGAGACRGKFYKVVCGHVNWKIEPCRPGFRA